MVGLALSCAHFNQEKSEHRGGILVEVFVAASLVHGFRAIEHRINVDPSDGGTEQPDRRQR